MYASPGRVSKTEKALVEKLGPSDFARRFEVALQECLEKFRKESEVLWQT
jgi:hypothetical protein